MLAAPRAVTLPPRAKRNYPHLDPVRDPVRILLVEPEESEYAILRALIVLGNSLAHVTWVESAAAALEAVDGESFDVCLCTVAPATEAWLDQLPALRSHGMPVVVLVQDRDRGLDTHAMAAGAQDFLVKTRLDPFMLERAIRYARLHARTMAALRRSEQSFRGLIENAPDAVLVNRAGRIVYVNPQALRWLGYGSADEMVSRPLCDVHAGEHEFRRRDGSLVTADVATIPVDWSGEAATALVARDLTERKLLEGRLRAADRMASLGTLAAGVAHEINNPLAYVLAHLELLRGAVADPALTDEIDRAREGAERVRAVVRDLKMFSRADEEAPRSVDVHRVLDSAIDMAQNEIRHRARLVREYGTLPPARATEARLGQVFLNLLVNAAQAIEEGAADRNEIRVRTQAAGESVVVEVRDSGCGMAPSVRERIFDPFFTTKPVGVGTGLGLSIVHGIVTTFGGRIEVESEVGRGTCFRLTLPAGAPLVARTPPPPTEPVAQASGATVLVIDDEPAIGRVIGRLLSRTHQVTVMTSARTALEQIQKGARFDVILCDLMMPDLSGMDLHPELAKFAPEQAARMIFMTGGAFTARSREFLDRMRFRIEKPFERAQLVALIAQCSRSHSVA